MIEQESLLKENESNSHTETAEFPDFKDIKTWKPSRRRSFSTAIAIHGGLIFVYSLIFTMLMLAARKEDASPLSDYEPFQEVPAIDGLDITRSESSKEILEMSDYHGDPDEEMDALWHDLLKLRFIAVSGEELERNGRTSVAITPDGPYLAWLGVFHELHCIDFIRKYVHREYYYPNITSYEDGRIQNHADHCMDRIQALLMCHPDYSTLTTLQWTENPKPMVYPLRTMKKCVDWDRLTESLRMRVITEEELGRLKNPLLSDP